MKRFHSKAMKENLSDLQGQNSSDSEYRHVNGFDLRAMKVNLSDLQGRNTFDS